MKTFLMWFTRYISRSQPQLSSSPVAMSDRDIIVQPFPLRRPSAARTMLPSSATRRTPSAMNNGPRFFANLSCKTLIRTALANNYDIRIAARRVLEQQAQVQITRSQEFPQITGGGTGVGATLPSNLGVNIASPLAFGSFNLGAAWNPDFWGLYRKQTEAARAQLLAQTWAQRAVRLTLIQQVVSTYIDLRATDRKLEITKQTLKVRQDSLELTEKLERGGSAPLSDVRQAEQLLYTASSQVPQLEQQIQQDENALRLLLGANPGPVAHTAPDALAPPPQDLPTGLPSQLLERRPDIQQAEQTLVAANAQIGIARAQFFPQLSITTSAGVGGNEFSNLFDVSGKTIYGIGSLTQPIFEGGKLRGQLKLSRETKEEMVLNYQKTIATAFRDVSNALIALEQTARVPRGTGKASRSRAGRHAARTPSISGRRHRISRGSDHRLQSLLRGTEPRERAARRSRHRCSTLQRIRRRLAIV